MYTEANEMPVGARKKSSPAWLVFPLTTALIALSLAIALPYPAGADIGAFSISAPQPGL